MKEINFNDLPQVMADVLDRLIRLEENIAVLLHQSRPQAVNNHIPMTVEEAAEYTKIPLNTLYPKLASGVIPATKPGKRYVLYRDELDKWLEANRKNAIPLTDEELNAEILASNRRKPKRMSL